MFCEFCGNQIRDGAVFCDRCGRQIALVSPPQEPSAPPPGPAPGPGPEPAPIPRPIPGPISRQGALAPFVLILAVYFFWFFWRTFGLAFLVFGINLYTLPPEDVSWYASLALPPLLNALTTLGPHHFAALAGLAAVLILTGLKKINPRVFSWKDVVPMSILCIIIPVFPLVQQYFISQFGQTALVGFQVFSYVANSPIPSVLTILELWLICIAFMLIRSGSLRVTWKKALICLGVLICASLALSVYGSMTVQNYVEMYYSNESPILLHALEITRISFFFLWFKWFTLLWFATDSASGLLPFWGRLVFSVMVTVGFVFLCPTLLFGSFGFPRFGPGGAALAIPVAFLLGAVVLLVFRLVHLLSAARRKPVSPGTPPHTLH